MKKQQLNAAVEHETLKDLVNFAAGHYGAKPAFLYAEGKNTAEVSFEKLKSDVDCLGTWMFAHGYRDCHIAVFGENSYPWLLTYFAVVCGRNVIVPIDKDLPPEEVAELLERSECRAMFYSRQYADIAQEVGNLHPELADLYAMKEIPGFLEEGKALLESGMRDYLDVPVRREDLATIVFTSGTSGKSKGVMLSHGNFCADTAGSCEAVEIYEGTCLLVLPLHHTFGLVTNVFSAICYGYPVYINRSLKRIVSDIQKVKPFVLCAVPLFIETMYKAIWDNARKQGKDRLLKRMMKVSDALLACGIDVRRKLFRSVLDSFGGNLELIVSGGAAIEDRYIRMFRSLGITIQNGYGITECSPVVSVTRGHKPLPGSVGQPLSCNEIRISEEGEILIRGSNVMMGYYQDEKANAETFMDGWLRTGDLGRLDEKGNLYITGRIKNLIILSNGENISAEAIEEELYRIPYVKEAIAYGRNGIITAELFLDDTVADAAQRIHGDISELNRKLPQVKNIGNIVLRDTEFPKTSTRKIKRHMGGNRND